MKAKRFIRLFFLFTIQCIIVNSLFAQTNPYGEVSIASPTAASLGKYADVPVNYHTGIPQIDIPLYTVQSGPLKLPISLSYHAGGLKVIETASWVGAGWSLNAGGVITRTVMGLPDEKNTGSGAIDVYGYFSDSGFNKYLYQNGADQDWLGFAQGRKDGEPDLFFFNFGGYSGKFFFRDDWTPVIVPQQDIKIVPRYLGNNASIQGFTLITPDGTHYYFGNTPGITGAAPVEKTNPYSAESGYLSGNVLSSWFLNKVVSADGMFNISLNYTAESYGYYTMSSFPVDSYNAVWFPGKEIGLVKNIISGVRLSQINFPNGVVTFKGSTLRTDLSDDVQNNSDGLNASASILDSITIAGNSGFCKKFVFKTSYFTDNGSALPSIVSTYTLTTDKKRLKLDSVQELSCDNTVTIPPYKFVYFGEQVPRRINLGIDHWGFYNGAIANQTLIPSFTTFDGSTTTSMAGAIRDANWPAMRGGALQQIVYPVGGSTTFDFEPDDSYTKSTTSLQSVGLGIPMLVHLYGQDTKYTDVMTFVSNGNEVTVLANNNSQWAGTITVKNSSNVTVATSTIPNNTYPGSTNTTFKFTVAAGTYQATLTIPVGPGSGEGILANFSQLAYVTNVYPIIIGGLRIKSITNKTGTLDPNPIVTNYSYPLGGYLYSFPTYIQHMYNDMVNTYGFYSPVDGFHYTYGTLLGCPTSGNMYKKSGGSLRQMATTQGYHIGFPTVKVSQTGNGYSLYNYYTSNNGYAPQTVDPSIQTINTQTASCGPNEPNYPPAPLPFDFKKGELYSEQHFNEAGNILKDVYYAPEFDTVSTLSTPGFIVTTISTGGLLGTVYNIYAPRKTKMHTIETSYTPGIANGVTTHTYTYYGSVYHNQPTRKVVSTSTGDSLITNTKYSADFHCASCDISPNCEANYISACNTCLAIDTAAHGGTTAFLAYRKCLSVARNTYVNCRRTNYTGPGNYYDTHLTTAISGGSTELKPLLLLQDSNRVVPIEESQWRNANLLHSNFTRYDFVTSPAGFPYPQKTQLINLQAPSASFTNSALSGTTITKDSRYLDESTYLFANGNPAHVISHDGVPISYVWDYLNTNPIAKVSNGSSDQIAFTSFEADGKGNWTFTGVPVSDAASITGSKDYNLTSGTVTKSGLVASKTYVVSYWSKSGSAVVNGATSTALIAKSGWSYFEHTITGTTSASVSGSVVVDELRLYPSDAQMTSYTYTPLVGISSSSSPAAYISYYEYDALARLLRIRDMDKNIIKQYEYGYGIPATTYMNTMQFATYTRNNCGGGYTGSSVNDTIPAGVYGSNASQAAANQKAINDLAANGQAYANSHGTCTLNMATITSTNPAGTSGFKITYTNTSTLVATTFTIPAIGGILGTLAPGTYNIHIAKQPVGSILFYLQVNCNSLSVYAKTADFNNVVVTPTSCNGVNIDLP